jgi:hypothetical protein
MINRSRGRSLFEETLHMNFARRQKRLLPLLLLVATSTLGCGGADDGRIAVYPVRGKVMVNGAPAEGAKVVLYGATPELSGRGSVLPSGVTDANGEFRLRSYEPGDGTPAGEYQVSILWLEPIPEDADQEMYEPKDRLELKFADPAQSGLVAEVPEGGCELPIFNL